MYLQILYVGTTSEREHFQHLPCSDGHWEAKTLSSYASSAKLVKPKQNLFIRRQLPHDDVSFLNIYVLCASLLTVFFSKQKHPFPQFLWAKIITNVDNSSWLKK
jgi:hypothetical protein